MLQTKLIIQKIGDKIFVYRESEKHYEKVKDNRKSSRLTVEDIDYECLVSNRDDFHMVFDIKDK